MFSRFVPELRQRIYLKKNKMRRSQDVLYIGATNEPNFGCASL
jgi:hypothetical protein